MPPSGYIHRRPRSDSGAARLFDWARKRRGPWTSQDAADAAAITPRRARTIIQALGDAGLLSLVSEAAMTNAGMVGEEWEVSPSGRSLPGAPILITDAATGVITGVRIPSDGRGVEKLRRLVERSQLSGREAAARLGVNDRTLRRILSGETPIADDDPILRRADELK